jgi:hypothetical protein
MSPYSWKNNAKKSVVSTMIIVENEVCMFCFLGVALSALSDC